jgi:heptosyltransferase-2
MKILIIQTAFLGDVILASAIIEKLKQHDANNEIDFLLRKGNESVFNGHPLLNQVLVYNKQKNKYKNLLNIIKSVRKASYDYVINVNRFFTAGLITAFSGAKIKIGFDKSPFVRQYNIVIKHELNKHEIERNLSLIGSICETSFIRPKLYPSELDFETIRSFKNYICVAPATIWFTKQLPINKWCELINKLPTEYKIYLVGSADDIALCEHIRNACPNSNIEIVAGKFSILQSAALIKNAIMTYANDSTPLHLASSMNAPVTAFYCSTVPSFGFTPVSDDVTIIETDEKLACRPCGLSGKSQCKEGHFKCANLNINKALEALSHNT